MKVLHLIGGEDFGGAKSHVISLVNELKKYIDVKLITFRKGGFSSDAQKYGIDIEVVKTKNFISDIKRIIQIIKTEKITMVHSHGAKANMFALIIKIFTRIPTITTVHSDYRLDYMDSFIKKYSFGIINAIAIRIIDFRVGVSDSFKKMLIKRNFNPEKIFKLYNGIKYDFNENKYSRDDFLKRYNIKTMSNSCIVGILARLHPVKGINVFLDAAGIISKKHPETIFVIGGDGEERRNLEEKAKKLGILSKTHFIGYVEDPYEFMECIDINTLTSLSESFPYVILEGANQRKTVVSSNVGGISDLLLDGENGFLFEPGDYKKLAQHVEYLIENKEKRELLGENLYKEAKEKFSLINMGKTQLQIYKDIVEILNIDKQSSKKFDVLLSGYYGFNNLGDDAMLLGIIDSLKKYNPYLRILILSKNPMQTRLKFSHNTVSRINIFSIIYNMRKSSLFINGGGNLIQDTTSTRSLLYYLGAIFLAKVLGMKVMIYGNGIGPLRKGLNQKISANILNKVDVITLREELSLDVLNQINILSPTIKLTADPALTIDTEFKRPNKNILFDYQIDTNNNLVGFSVRSCRDGKKAIQELSKIADYVVDKYGALPIFIPMHHPDDVKTSEKIAKSMKNNSIVISNKYEVTDLLYLMSKLKILVGMRLHSLIFALKLNIPALGISYEPKVEGFLDMIEQDSSINIYNIKFETSIEKIDNLWENYDKIKEGLRKKNTAVTDLSKKNSQFAIELLKKGK